MNLFDFFRRKTGLQTKSSATSSKVISAYSLSSHKDYSDYKNAIDGYKGNVTVYRVIRMISQEVAKVPLILYKNGELLTAHPLLELLNNPNQMQGKTEFIEELISYKLISGNSYVEAAYPEQSTKYQSTPPSFLYVLNPQYMSINGNQHFTSSFIYDDTRNKVVFPVSITGQSNIMHLKEFNPTNGVYGMSPMESAGVNIDQANSANVWNYNLLKNGGKPSGILKVNSELSHQQKESLKDAFTNNYAGSNNSGKMLVVDGDIDYQETGLSPSDMDFLNTVKLSAQFIAFAFGVPYDLINTDQAKYDNLEKAYELLWDSQVKPQTESLISELNRWLTPRYGDDLKLGFDESKIGAVQYKKDRQRQSLDQTSFMTINEKRKVMGLDDISGGDDLLIDSNKLPVSLLGVSDVSDEENEKQLYFKSLLNKGYSEKLASELTAITYDHSKK